MNTYQHPVSSRQPIAWALSAVLFAFYLLLYFTEHLTGPAKALRLGDKWTLYAVVYTIAMVVGGIFFLRRHGKNSPYQKWRTASVVFAQVVLAFLLPKFMTVMGKQEYYFSY